jgi:hypothetical protein
MILVRESGLTFKSKTGHSMLDQVLVWDFRHPHHLQQLEEARAIHLYVFLIYLLLFSLILLLMQFLKFLLPFSVNVFFPSSLNLLGKGICASPLSLSDKLRQTVLHISVQNWCLSVTVLHRKNLSGNLPRSSDICAS